MHKKLYKLLVKPDKKYVYVLAHTKKEALELANRDKWKIPSAYNQVYLDRPILCEGYFARVAEIEYLKVGLYEVGELMLLLVDYIRDVCLEEYDRSYEKEIWETAIDE